VDNPSNSRADGAYDRALAAYQEKSYEVARRWVLEALAHNKQHAGARALLGRLDAARQPAGPFQSAAAGPEVVSTDPTVLISRASLPSTAEPIEPTVMIRRDDPRRPLTDTDTHVGPLSSRQTESRPVAEPTVIAQPKQRTAPSRPAPSHPSSPSSRSKSSLGAALQSLGERLQGRGRAAQPAAPRGRSTAGSWTENPQTRGALIAIAAVAVGALLVWGTYRTIRWMFPPGQKLTITKPTGGTIVGHGIECGTTGTKCSTTIPTGEPVELEARADNGYSYMGFTGDCTPTGGRTVMSEPRTCGATFGPVVAPAASTTFLLTITKPQGGSVVAAGGILCGDLGSICSAAIPSGAPVTLQGQASAGFRFEQFTGDCPNTGEMTMSSAMTCGAVFTPAPGGTTNVTPGPRGGVKETTTATSHGGRSSNPIKTTPDPPPVLPQGSANPGTVTPGTPQPPAGSDPNTAPTGTPPPPADTSEQHAKKEIQSVITGYCSALETLKPGAVQHWFNTKVEREYKTRFSDMKSLKCILAEKPPEYITLEHSKEPGVAQLKFGMKQVIKMASGGAPNEQETIITMVLSRKNFQTPWLIDRVAAEEKPK